MAVTGQQSGQRKRGIQASRRRLTEALTAAGMKTQAALAERIADLESLESVPKDMVSRAFREMPMEPTSLERIARALDVPAHTLYKTSDELTEEFTEEPGGLKADVDGVANARPGWHIFAVAAAVAVVFAGALVWILPTTPPAQLSYEHAGEDSTPAEALDLGRMHVVVMPLGGDQGAGLSSHLRRVLAERFHVASATATATLNGSNVKQVADKLRAEIVLDGELLAHGRLTGVTLFAFYNGVRHQIWAESFATVEFDERKAQIARRAVRGLERLLDPGSGTLAYFPLAPVLEDYLAGEALLDQPANELNLKRAQSRFEAALRQDANFALAHAGLCEVLLEQHWMFEEDRMLRDASGACSQALLLEPSHPVVASAHAHFYSRTGRREEAIALYEEINAAHPNHAAAYAGLAAALLDGYRQTGQVEKLERAKAAARQAALVDPVIWKPLFNLAAMEWFSGDNDAAIAASQAALARDENEYVLANLGTLYICTGQFEQARETYLRARQIAPQSYVGDEFLGMTHYFLGEYEEAVRLRRRAIASIGEGAPEMHEMWGQLGDALRMNGARGDAVDAYLRAAEIAERDYLRGNAPVADRAARAYYYTALQSLAPERLPGRIVDSLAAELDDIAGAVEEATAHRRMAQIWVLRGELEKARAAVARATGQCPGYGLLPEFAVLNTDSRTP